MATPVALYARSLPDLDREGFGVERQLADLRAFAAVRGWEVIEELEDPGRPVPGDAPRSVLARARGRLLDGSIRGIIAWRLDLLVRDVNELRALLADAETAGGFVATIEDSIDTSHAAGRAIGRAIVSLEPATAVPATAGPLAPGPLEPVSPEPRLEPEPVQAEPVVAEPELVARPEPEGPVPPPAATFEPMHEPAHAEPMPEPAEPMPEPEPMHEPAPAERMPEPMPEAEPEPEPEVAPEPEPAEPMPEPEPEVVRVLLPEVVLGVLPSGIRPYGLTTDWSTVVQAEAQVIRSCYRRLQAGASLRQLARRLNRRGIRTSTGGRWRANQLGRTLTADYVAGMRLVRGVPTQDGVLPVIVTRGELQRLRELLADQGWGPRSYRRHLLVGLVRCGRCGEPLIGRPRRGRARRYVCGRPPVYRGCGRVRIAAQPVEQLVEEALIHALSAPHITAALGAAATERGEPLPGFAALSVSPRETWLLLPLDSRRAVLRLLVERIDIASGGLRRRFDPSRVEIAWRY